MAAHALWANMVLGLHLTDDFVDVKGHGVTIGGNTVLSVAQQKFGKNTAFFDGTGDYLNLTPSADFTFGTGDFYIGGHFYTTSAASSVATLFNLGVESAADGLRLYRSSAGDVYLLQGGVNRIVTSTAYMPLNTWVHIGLSRVGNTYTLYKDWTPYGTTYTAGSPPNMTNTTFSIGTDIDFVDASTNYKFGGYIADVVAIKGGGPYNSTNIPIDAPFLEAAQLIGNTLDASGAGVSATVRAYLSSTGDEKYTKVSDAGTGAFAISVSNTNPHDVVCDFGSTENKQIFSSVIPV